MVTVPGDDADARALASRAGDKGYHVSNRTIAAFNPFEMQYSIRFSGEGLNGFAAAHMT
ncbi:hypothetical protein TRN7648_00881 [Tropicibacter naphthalenivorans]|uniref:Uncharacterized protein n=1 Tax=Tropicibacter naphthalenivorans TaxID=441103 RepID=A0A0P1G3E5_9RHOB|nr:hypothetical protein TRN7648_00881 [Tropicibacter naphthalenivorans]